MDTFMEKIKEVPELREKYEAILKKHEAARDRDAFAADISAFARSEGYAIEPDKVMSALAPGGEIGEEDLEKVSGGGSGLMLCNFSIPGEIHGPVVRDDSLNPPFKRLCDSGRVVNPYFCNWAFCRCWGTKHCVDGYHHCNEDGSYVRGHSWEFF